jgi:hypothetical protein
MKQVLYSMDSSNTPKTLLNFLLTQRAPLQVIGTITQTNFNINRERRFAMLNRLSLWLLPQDNGIFFVNLRK